jgi:hypothetical protein
MNHRDGEKHVEAGRETFPADDQSAVLALEPRKRPFGLKARDGPFLGAPRGFLVFHTRLEIWGRIPRRRRRWRRSLAS